MSSKFKILSIALAALLLVGLYTATSKADVTGSFGVLISFSPIQCQDLEELHGITGFPDQPCEKTIFKIDFETNLNVNITISGLTLGLHSHAGVTGFEDIIITFATTLGALDINDTFVFAQAFGNVTSAGQSFPTCFESAPGSGSCLTIFVKKRVEASISLGGVTVSNLALFEDVNFPNYCANPGTVFVLGIAFCSLKTKPTGATYTTQSQAFGFGDVLTISGQTASGITVTAETGICAQQTENVIKKHHWPFEVNPDCAAGKQTPSVKPPLFFDFEKIWIEGIPLASNLTLDLHVECNVPAGLLCDFAQVFTITGGPIFSLIQVTTGFSALPLGAAGTSFSDILVLASSGGVTILLTIDPANFTVSFWQVTASFTINPDTNPASLRLRAQGVPGLSFLEAVLTVRRAGLTFVSDLDFDASPAGTFDFDDLTLSLRAEAGIVTIAASIVIDEQGTTPEEAFLLGGNVSFTVNF